MNIYFLAFSINCKKCERYSIGISYQYLGYKQFSRHCDICKDFELKIPAIQIHERRVKRIDVGEIIGFSA